MFFQQVAFLGHDLGHNGVTHCRFTDETIGILFGNILTGISVGWWKATHNVHHLVTNSVEYDPDIQHMPVFAVSDRYVGEWKEGGDGTDGGSTQAPESEANPESENSEEMSEAGEEEGGQVRQRTVAGAVAGSSSSTTSSSTKPAANSTVTASAGTTTSSRKSSKTSQKPKTFVPYQYGQGIFSHYHMKTFEFDRVSHVLLSYQHLLYYPIMALARFNLYLQSWILLWDAKVYRKWGGNRRGVEIAGLGKRFEKVENRDY